MRTKEQYRVEISERRREAKENGFCMHCFTREAMPEHVLCGRCAELKSDTKARMRLRRRTALKPLRTRKHTIKPERVVDPERLKRIHDFPCVICWLCGEVQESPTEVHHMKHMPDGTILKMNQKAGDDMSLPLCQKKHHWNSVHVAIALRVFEARYGSEPELLVLVNAWLEKDVPYKVDAA
jgi:hypothetical protein